MTWSQNFYLETSQAKKLSKDFDKNFGLTDNKYKSKPPGNVIKLKSNQGNNFQDLSSILATPHALNNQQNLSSEDEDFQDNENILEDVSKEDELSL